MPSLSHASRSSGAGALWEVRIALQPISRSLLILYSCSSYVRAEPTHAKSWCRQAPRISSLLPFRKNPSSGSNLIERTPYAALSVSVRFPQATVVVISQSSGVSTSQTRGLLTRSFPFASAFPKDGTTISVVKVCSSAEKLTETVLSISVSLTISQETSICALIALSLSNTGIDFTNTESGAIDTRSRTSRNAFL